MDQKDLHEKKSITEFTIRFVEENPSVKACLKKGFINYSALARKIGDANSIKNNSSFDAIVVALRRYKEKLDIKTGSEKSILALLSKSETSIKNKISVFVIEKNTDIAKVDEIKKHVQNEAGTFYYLEGSATDMIITQEKYSEIINVKLKHNIIIKKNNLSMVILNTSPNVEKITGVVAFITSLLAENEINIHEIISCWTDTILVIDSKDLNKAINILQF